MRTSPPLTVSAALLACLAVNPFHNPAQAKVSPEEAARLGMPGEDTELTPLGAIRAGSEDGTIPPWTGGITQPPPGYQAGGWYVDPYADDEILFTITADNYQQYADKLTTGTKALFERYPDTFKMNVYPSRRSMSFADWYYEGSIKNATSVEWCPNEDPTLKERCIIKETYTPGVFFPIPKTGGEAMWNHTYFNWGKNWNAHAYGMNAYADGGYADHLKVDRWILVHLMPEEEKNPDPYFDRFGGAVMCGSQEDIYPPRTAGQMFGGCNGFTNNDVDAYLYIPGQRRVRKAPEIGFYDSPGTGSDGLRTADERFLFAITGEEEWYEYSDPVRRELYAPNNAYKMAQPGITFDDIARAGHINPELVRYELHRHWVIEANLRPQFRHLGPRRFVYLDEDNWMATTHDMYDAEGNLWRVSQSYNINFYDEKISYFWGDSHMDLLNGRYALVNAWHNIGAAEGNPPPQINENPAWEYQTPAGLRRLGVR